MATEHDTDLPDRLYDRTEIATQLYFGQSYGYRLDNWVPATYKRLSLSMRFLGLELPDWIDEWQAPGYEQAVKDRAAREDVA